MSKQPEMVLNPSIDESLKTEKPVKKVCILGYAPHLNEAPFEDLSWEMWGINSLYKHLTVPLTRFSSWFEIHSLEFLAGRQDKKAVGDHFYMLSQFKCPLYMKDHYNQFPASVAYPIEEVMKYLKCSRYFTNTISYMIALAIAQQYTDIAIYGVDMAVGTEYEAQRPSCEYFIGIAEGRGINVSLPQTCDLLRSNFMYGLEDLKEEAYMLKLKSTREIIVKRKNEAHQAALHNTYIEHEYIGAEKATNEWMKIWGTNGYKE